MIEALRYLMSASLDDGDDGICTELCIFTVWKDKRMALVNVRWYCARRNLKPGWCELMLLLLHVSQSNILVNLSKVPMTFYLNPFGCMFLSWMNKRNSVCVCVLWTCTKGASFLQPLEEGEISGLRSNM